MKSTNPDPAAVLRRAREMAGLSQREAATLSGLVTPTQLSALERADDLAPRVAATLLRKAAERQERTTLAVASTAHLNAATELALDGAALAAEHLIPDH